MKKASGTILAVFGLFALVAASGSIAWAQTAERQVSASPTKAEIAQFQATAEKATAKIQASPSDTKMVAEASRAKSTEQAKSVLLKNGFTAKQLESAKLVFQDSTGKGGGGAAQRVKVTIKGSCCPLTITIIIAF